MFGVALDIKLDHFKQLLRAPKPALVGILSQFVLLPALTIILVLLLQPAPSLALGMILVAACPGGNVSNFMTHLAGGNAALSVSLTAFSSVAAIIMTPFGLAFWGGLYGPSAELLQEVQLNVFQVFVTVGLIIALPLTLGVIINHKNSTLAHKLSRRLKPISILIFLIFILVAFSKNFDLFLDYIHLVIFLVLLHNALALSLGYFVAKLFNLSPADRKSIAIETGIQNSGLGLLLIFNFFGGLGGMALVAAWWGIWHIISGLLIAFYWSRSTTIASAS